MPISLFPKPQVTVTKGRKGHKRVWILGLPAPDQVKI